MPPTYRNALGLLLIPALSMPWLTACDAFHSEDSTIDGYWKGQIVETGPDDAALDTDARERYSSKRILLRLDSQAGIVQGEYAQSSDMVAFRRAANQGIRTISKHAVSGTFDAPELSLRFSGDDGQNFEISARVDGKRITGTYVASNGAAPATGVKSRTGTFAVKKD